MNLRFSWPLVALLIVAPAWSSPPQAAPALLMLISVDGLKPEAILDAQAHGLKAPDLRAFLHDGIYADGVRGVLPTLTYPSHTTLISGA